MLNITGGGTHAVARDFDLIHAAPDITIPREEIGTPAAVDKILSLF